MGSTEPFPAGSAITGYLMIPRKDMSAMSVSVKVAAAATELIFCIQDQECKIWRWKKVNKSNPGWILISLCVITFSSVKAQENPHGDQKLTCEDCHTSISWEDIHFDHEATHYKLESAHVRVSCSDWHALDDFSAVRRECLSCHTDVHEAKLGSECVRCHSPSRWEIFDTEEHHRDTRCPVMGRHNLIDCGSCHANLEEGDFTRGTTDCVDCHENIYLSTENPRHVSLGFSTACVECHEPPQWNPAFFPGHDALFPIFSGEHDGSWDGCADCHPDPGS